MIDLSDILHHWGTEAFRPELEGTLQALAGQSSCMLPCMEQGGILADGSLRLTSLTTTEHDGRLQVRTTAFFSELVGGCSCGDDPFTANGACELVIDIDRATGKAVIEAQPHG